MSSWVVVDGKTNTIGCDFCGKSEPIPLPMEVRAFVRWCEAVEAKHKKCGVNLLDVGTPAP